MLRVSRANRSRAGFFNSVAAILISHDSRGNHQRADDVYDRTASLMALTAGKPNDAVGFIEHESQATQK